MVPTQEQIEESKNNKNNLIKIQEKNKNKTINYDQLIKDIYIGQNVGLDGIGLDTKLAEQYMVYHNNYKQYIDNILQLHKQNKNNINDTIKSIDLKTYKKTIEVHSNNSEDLVKLDNERLHELINSSKLTDSKILQENITDYKTRKRLRYSQIPTKFNNLVD